MTIPRCLNGHNEPQWVTMPPYRQSADIKDYPHWQDSPVTSNTLLSGEGHWDTQNGREENCLVIETDDDIDMVMFVCNPNLEEVLNVVTIYDFTVSFVQTRYSSRDNGSNDKVLDYSFLPLLDEADKFCLRQVCVQINQFFFIFLNYLFFSPVFDCWYSSCLWPDLCPRCKLDYTLCPEQRQGQELTQIQHHRHIASQDTTPTTGQQHCGDKQSC